MTTEWYKRIVGTGKRITINSNQEVQSGRWKDIQRAFIKLIHSPRLIFLFDVKKSHEPRTAFRQPTKEEIMKICYKFVAEASMEIQPTFKKLHLHITINPFYHDKDLDVDFSAERCKDWLRKATTTPTKPGLSMYVSPTNQPCGGVGDYRYLKKDKPSPKRFRVTTSIELLSGTEIDYDKKFRRDGQREQPRRRSRSRSGHEWTRQRPIPSSQRRRGHVRSWDRRRQP